MRQTIVVYKLNIQVAVTVICQGKLTCLPLGSFSTEGPLLARLFTQDLITALAVWKCKMPGLWNRRPNSSAEPWSGPAAANAPSTTAVCCPLWLATELWNSQRLRWEFSPLRFQLLTICQWKKYHPRQIQMIPTLSSADRRQLSFLQHLSNLPRPKYAVSVKGLENGKWSKCHHLSRASTAL